ncbi:flavohemoglobin expression-modulating QEGLA motif protein [Sphingobacterium corticibacterium]|uniref:Flavohemoglobin expression-modulating QEGLA motif protein n=1 Tax=Sphingobacterium corticibacterium TaxID=2484746 RepID=A0A4Q6XNM7_9SPHI|nr:flavohemoglobin expression-modulating QEGLA motif protein [Sphingobacterium corticibacterium]RZF61770.1 flavohemoglobin expression-modulating QEGLA motif protein [Sphingobacterium corticibacterium]
MEFKDKILPQLLRAIKNRTPIHKQIPNKGKIIFNKIVPYLFIYRVPDSGKDRMLSELTKSELASVIFLPNNDDDQLSLWIPKLATALANEFGTCLLIEVWNAPIDQDTDIAIHLSQKNALVLAEYLKKNIETEAPEISVELKKETKLPRPPRLPLLVNTDDTKSNIVLSLGISVRKTYEDIDGVHLPLLARIFRESLAKGLSRSFFEFVRLYTTAKATEFKMKGQEKLYSEIYDIDRALAKESQKFDFLLLVTPTNSHEAWLQFKKDKYRKAPIFHYRPIPIDPDIVKRNLYNLRIEDIYDPTIAYLFRDKRRELDDMMTMLASRGTSDFKYGSLMVFGNVDEQLYDLAKAVLTAIDSIAQPDRQKPEEEYLDAKAFAQLAEEEISFLQQQSPTFKTSVRVRDDIAGVMVNHGVLNISKQYKISKRRALALIQHEVGTHIITYFNGKEQPFSFFRLGVPGYEQLQEGLAVLAEYLVGGLTNERLRILAGRVIAVQHMLLGHSFVETFDMLHEEYGFSTNTSFTMTMRVYRSGGLTKDTAYLQGFKELIQYIQEGKDLNLLTIGKIREDYLPIVHDLIQRGVLRPPRIKPRYLHEPYTEKLKDLNQFASIFKMINY